MLIKIIKNGIASDWFELTKKGHRELLMDKPDTAIVHIEDLYANFERYRGRKELPERE